ncbi:hypothetical protein K3495_g3077 [Podosphaera aphanis]|nr:hypothetical protein K3495_g3077 [Podosphaera aphanis]
MEFQSLVFNRGIRSAASATDNGDHDDIGFTNLKCKEADKGKNIPLEGEIDENINYLPDQGNGSDDSDNESDSIRKKEPKGKKKKRGSKGADSDNDSGKTYIPDWAKGIITEGTSISRALMDLGKLYVNPQEKFEAKHYEVLENKLRIFFEKCQIAGVGENQFKNAFLKILRDAAHGYYFRHLAEHLDDLIFDEMVHKTKERFDTKTEEQNYLT